MVQPKLKRMPLDTLVQFLETIETKRWKMSEEEDYSLQKIEKQDGKCYPEEKPSWREYRLNLEDCQICLRKDILKVKYETQLESGSRFTYSDAPQALSLEISCGDKVVRSFKETIKGIKFKDYRTIEKMFLAIDGAGY